MAYLHQESITIDHTKCGSADSTNFPMLVSGTYTPLKTVANGGEVISSSGYDIQFFSDSGLTTALKFERVIWVASSGLCEFWVKIPTLSHTSDTVIYIAWGDATVITDQQDAANTWDSIAKAVWHLQEASGTLADSTGTGATMTAHASPTYGATGQIGNAMTFVSASSQYLDATHNAALNSASYTVSAWIKRSSNPTECYVLSHDGDATNHGWAFGLYQNKIMCLHQNVALLQSTSTITDTNWHHIGYTYDGSTVRFYLDGAANGTASSSAFTAVSATIVIAADKNTSGVAKAFFPGSLDEVRYDNAVRSADWLLSNYNNQNNPSTFYTVGTEQNNSSFIARPNRFISQAIQRASNY